MFMVKLLEPAAFLRQILPLLQARADEARLARPCELGLLVEGTKLQLTFTRRGVKLASDKLGAAT